MAFSSFTREHITSVDEHRWWLATALHAAWDNRGARTGCLSSRGPSCQQTYAAKIKQGFTGRR